MSEKFYVGLDITSFENSGKYKPVSRITLTADDENAITAGDDSGMELAAPCPHATQAMANSILSKIKGFQYQAYSADAASLDPAAELGDGVNVSGIYSTISRISDDGDGYSGISAPGETELEEEYPSAGPMTKAFNRKISETRSQITKTAEEIRLQVEATDGRVTSLSVSLDGVVSRVQGIEGNVSSIEQYVDSITLSVANGSTSSTISLKAGGVEIASQTITMNGLVTFNGLRNGTTTIDGACIKTGTIEANRLDLTGSITFSDLSSSVRNNIDDAYSTAVSAGNMLDRWTYEGTTYIDGQKLMTGTVRASSLEGGSVSLLNSAGQTVGIMTMTGATTAYFAVDLTSYGALRLTAQGGNAFLQSGYGSFVQCGNRLVSFGTDIGPAGSGNANCGTSSHRWSVVYSVSGMITTSDRTKKEDISYDLDRYDTFFDSLSPASYKLIEGESGRTHLGLISQDVETSLEIAGLSSMDFGGFIKTPQYDEQGDLTGHEYALRYNEFVPLCIRRIKMLEDRIKRLEDRYGN